MFTLEFCIIFLLLIQPPIFGFLFFSLVRAGVAVKFYFLFFKTIRLRQKSIKFFECAVYSRLVNIIQYDIYILSFCILFILYDIDLVFFFTEIVYTDQWVFWEGFFLSINILFFFFGLWYDYIRLGFNWSH